MIQLFWKNLYPSTALTGINIILKLSLMLALSPPAGKAQLLQHLKVVLLNTDRFLTKDENIENI